MAPARRTAPPPLRLALLLALLACAAAARPAPPPRPPSPPSPPLPPSPPPAPTLPPAPPGPKALAMPAEGSDTTKMYYVFGGILGAFAFGVLGYCVWSASDKARAATAEYNEVVKRREFMEAQLARSAAGRRELEKIKAKRAADKASKSKDGKGGGEGAKDGEEAGRAGDLGTAGLAVLAGAALLA